MDSTKVGSSIALLRKKYGMTQLDLAEKLQVTDKAVSRWERGLGTPDTSLLVKLSIILDVDVETLLEGNVSNDELCWNGVLIFNYPEGITPYDFVYTKRIIYLQLSYFMLVGITDITLVGDKHNLRMAEDLVGNGINYGVNVHYYLQKRTVDLNDKKNIVSIMHECGDERNIMLINGLDIIYGKDFTKILRRVMNSITGPIHMVTFENKSTSIYFFQQNYNNNENIEEDIKCFCLERGVFCLNVVNKNDLLDASNLIRIIESHQSEPYMDIDQIAKHRNLIRC